jgi:hypothetical protein
MCQFLADDSRPSKGAKVLLLRSVSSKTSNKLYIWLQFEVSPWKNAYTTPNGGKSSANCVISYATLLLKKDIRFARSSIFGSASLNRLISKKEVTEYCAFAVRAKPVEDS